MLIEFKKLNFSTMTTFSADI